MRYFVVIKGLGDEILILIYKNIKLSHFLFNNLTIVNWSYSMLFENYLSKVTQYLLIFKIVDQIRPGMFSYSFTKIFLDISRIS